MEPPGSVIEVSLHDGLLTVRDRGPGFDEGDVDHVFDRFYRSPHARRSPGSGLGLAIVKQAAEVRGGFAIATNAPDGGAIVRVTFEPRLSSPRDPRRRVARR
jgi:two-component system, OmpR family, sensor histidine kinase MprB